ncbi:MAG: tetratricopeptide repeat protein, partial [Bacteroidia bacterium]
MSLFQNIKPPCRITILYLFMGWNFIALGQVNQQNSSNAQNSLGTKKSVKFQSQSLLEMYLDSARYLADKSPMRAVDFINKAIEESINTNNREKEALAFLILGDIQQQLGQHDLAVENYQKSIKRLSDLKPGKRASGRGENERILFRSWKHAAVSFTELGKYDEALTCINTGINNYSSSVSVSEVLDAKRTLANIYLKQGKIKESRGLLNEILLAEQNGKNTPGEIESLLLLAKTFQAQDNQASA